MNQHRIYLFSMFSVLSVAACGSGRHPSGTPTSVTAAGDSNSSATLPVQQGNIKLDPTATPAQVTSTAPEQVDYNLVANANLIAVGPWTAQGDVSFVRNGNDTDNAARLTVNYGAGQNKFKEGAVWLGQTIDLPCYVPYVFLRYDAKLPGSQQSVHVRLTTLDSGGGVIKSTESFGDLYPGQTGSWEIDAPAQAIATSLTTDALGATQLRVQFGMNDFDSEQFEAHAIPSAQNGSVAEFAHISVIATQDPNGQTPFGACNPTP